MFEGIKAFVKGVIRKMFSAKNVEKALDVKPCISNAMQEKLELWNKMYKGQAPWCKDYVKSLRKEQGICKEFANVALNEMDSKVSIERLDNIYKKAIRNLNENLQSGLAMGSFVIKPLGGYKVEYITADRFIPIRFDESGRLVDVVFIQIKRISDNNYYHRLEQHTLKDGMLTIKNKAFRSGSAHEIGREVHLGEIDEWQGLPDEVSYNGLDRPDFGYYRNPIKNEIDGSDSTKI